MVQRKKAKKAKKVQSAQPLRAPQEVFDAKIAKVIAAEMCGAMSEDDAKKFVCDLGRLAASVELIAPAMAQMSQELKTRRRIVEAAIRREHPSLVRSVVGTTVGVTWAGVKGVAALTAGMASSVVGLFRRRPRSARPQEEWSIPMLAAELERKKTAGATA